MNNVDLFKCLIHVYTEILATCLAYMYIGHFLQKITIVSERVLTKKSRVPPMQYLLFFVKSVLYTCRLDKLQVSLYTHVSDI
jgi:hypothetical protein